MQDSETTTGTGEQLLADDIVQTTGILASGISVTRNNWRASLVKLLTPDKSALAFLDIAFQWAKAC